MRRFPLWAVLALGALASACAPAEIATSGVPSEAPPVGRLAIRTANYPLAYFAERIAADDAEVRFPGPDDEDPAFWQPERATLREFQAAGLLLLNGPGYSKWAGPLSLPIDRMVDTTEGFRDALIEAEGVAAHHHGPEGVDAGHHAELTTWIDPRLAAEQARSIATALTRLDPRREALFAERLGALVADLDELEQRLTRAVAVDTDRPLLASHPVYGYLARRFGLDLRSVHFEPHLDPGSEGWADLDRILASHPARLMLWEGEPLSETVKQLEDRGIACVVFAPCASSPSASDWLASQSENARRLEEAFSATH